MSEDNEKTNDAYVQLEQEATKLTCDVLCSLIASTSGGPCNGENGSMDSSEACKTKTSKRSCPKQLQLPLFLSSK